MAPQCLKQWVTGCDPLKVALVRDISVSRQPGIARDQVWQSPIGLPLEQTQRGRCATWIEGVRQAGNGSQREIRGSAGIAEEAGNRLGNNPSFLRPRTSLDQHLQ